MSPSWQALVIGLWIVVLLQTGLVLSLYRQVGLVYLGQSPARTRDGLPLHSSMPSWEATDQHGNQITSASFDGRRLLLVFADPDCRPCQRLMPELKRFAETHAEEVDVIVAGSDPHGNREMVERYLLDFPVLQQGDSELLSRFRVSATPFAYIIDHDGRIREKGVVNSEDQLDAKLASLGAQQPDGKE